MPHSDVLSTLEREIHGALAIHNGGASKLNPGNRARNERMAPAMVERAYRDLTNRMQRRAEERDARLEVRRITDATCMDACGCPVAAIEVLALVYERTDQANAERTELGLPSLRPPSLRTVQRRMRHVTPWSGGGHDDRLDTDD